MEPGSWPFSDASPGDPDASGPGTLVSLPGAQPWSRMGLGLSPEAALYWLGDLCVIGFVILDLKKMVRDTSPAGCEDSVTLNSSLLTCSVIEIDRGFSYGGQVTQIPREPRFPGG